MVGVCGANDIGEFPDELIEPMRFEDWYGVERRIGGSHGIGMVHHSNRDPPGWSVTEGSRGTLLVYGYFTDRGGYETDEALCEALLNSTERTLAELDGSFALAAMDEDRLLAATDKLGTRTLYVAPEAEVFASHLGALSVFVDDPDIDVRAIAEMLQSGFTWGRKTLINSVDSLTYGEYVLIDDDVTIESYWRFDSEVDQRDYVGSVYDAFSDAVKASVDTIPDDRQIGVYLSGGLDSRLLAALVIESRSDITSLTYDANPGFGANTDLAKELAEELNIDSDWLTYTPEETARHLREGVARTDGMQSWTGLHALPGQLNEIDEYVDIMFWAGGQGELFGEDVPKTIYEGDIVSSFTEYWSNDVVDQILIDAPSLRQTFEEEFAKIDRETSYNQASELMIQNYYPRAHARGNITQTVVGVRIAHGLGTVVDSTTPVPKRYRWGPIPAYFNRLGHVLAPLKLELVQRHGGPVTRVPYERTGIPPKRSIWYHDASRIPERIKDLLGRSDDTTMFDVWYRENETLRNEIDELLYKSMTRPFFDENTLSSLRERHLQDDGNHIDSIAKVTTVEAWLQAYFD